MPSAGCGTKRQKGGIPMKNKKRVLVSILSMALLAGCGSSSAGGSAEELVQNAKTILTEANGYQSEFQAIVSVENTGTTTTTGQVTYVGEPLSMKVDTHMTYDDETQAMEYDQVVYLEENGDEVSQYMNYNGQWTEMTLSKDAAMQSVQVYDALGNMQILLDAAEDWQLASGAESGKQKLTAVIPEEKVYEVEEKARLFQLTGMSGLSEVYYSGTGDISLALIVDAKTGAPVSYELDLAQALQTVTNNVLKEMSGGTVDSGMTVQQYSVRSDFTKLDDVEAEAVPDAARSSAINYEREISLLEGAAE